MAINAQQSDNVQLVMNNQTENNKDAKQETKLNLEIKQNEVRKLETNLI